MKKKIFIVFGAILILISAFQNKIFSIDLYSGAKQYMSDMLNDSLNNGEISQDLYDDLMKQADEQISKAQMTDKLKENLFFFAVGQYANISGDVAASLLSDLADIWDYIYWDNDSQSFGFDEGIGDYIKNGLDSLIYDTPSGGDYVTGAWRSLPYQLSGWGRAYTFSENSANTAPVYITMLTNGQYVFGSFVGNQIVNWGGNSLNPYIYVTNTFQGSESLGYYGTYDFYNTGDMANWSNPYTSLNDALGALFGAWDTGEPVLNGKGIIVNENPVFPSLSPLGALNPNYKSIVINNYNNGYPYPPNRGLDINYYNYDYNFDVPFWEGQELETLEYPKEIEFPSVEFETIEVDQNVDNALEDLNGSWVVEFFLVAILLLILGLIL